MCKLFQNVTVETIDNTAVDFCTGWVGWITTSFNILLNTEILTTLWMDIYLVLIFLKRCVSCEKQLGGVGGYAQLPTPSPLLSTCMAGRRTPQN